MTIYILRCIDPNEHQEYYRTPRAFACRKNAEKSRHMGGSHRFVIDEVAVCENDPLHLALLAMERFSKQENAHAAK